VIASGGVSTLDDVRALCAVEQEGIMGAIIGRAIVRWRDRPRRRPALADAAGRTADGPGQTHHPLPGRGSRPGGQGRQVRRNPRCRRSGGNRPPLRRGQGADEITFLDITASSDDRETMVHVVEQVASRCSSR
jgi:hypothetical protein